MVQTGIFKRVAFHENVKVPVPNVFVFEEKHGSKRALWMPNPYVRNVKHHVQESESESSLKTAWYMLKQAWRPGKIVFRQHVKVPVPNVFDFQLLHFDLCLCCRQWSAESKCFQAKSARPRDWNPTSQYFWNHDVTMFQDPSIKTTQSKTTHHCV